MKVNIKKIDATRREMKFEVPAQRVSKTLDEVYESIAKKAKVKGFRAGKAPRHVIEAEHGALAQEETIRKVIPEVYQEALINEQLTPLDLPEIRDVELKDGAMRFTAMIDIKPEVRIKNYKGIRVKRKSSQVTDEEINKTLEYFRQGQGGDKNTEIDDSFAHGLGYPDLASFKQTLVRQLEIDKDRQNRVDVENQIVNALLKDAKLSVPQSLVRKQVEHHLGEARKRMQAQNLSQEDMAKQEESMRKNLKEPVERDVKAYLVLDKIAQMENIQIAEGESLPGKVMTFLLREAQWEDVK